MTEPLSDWPKRAEFYEADAPMQEQARKIVAGWSGTPERLVETLMSFLPTTWDRPKVERFIAKLRAH